MELRGPILPCCSEGCGHDFMFPRGISSALARPPPLGATTDTAPLREYARQLFAAPFAEGAVIVEDRLSVAEFLGDSTIEHVLQPRADFGEVWNPARYLGQEEAVAAWFKVFFPELPAPADVKDRAWRVILAERLKRHLLFVNLLKLMKGGVIDYADLLRQLQGPLPADARPHVRQVLDALLVLVAWARSEDGVPPFVTLRLQVWIRELRRMVARVAAAAETVDMRADADLAAAPGALYLPLVQCSECHTTGWLSRLAPGSSNVSTKRDEIYSTWFARRPEAVRLYPGRRLPSREVDGRDQYLCATAAICRSATKSATHARIRSSCRSFVQQARGPVPAAMSPSHGTTPRVPPAEGAIASCWLVREMRRSVRKWLSKAGPVGSTTTRS